MTGISSNEGYVKIFENTAGKTPHVPAVRFKDQTLSYFELNQRANQLASFLLKNGLEKNQIVGLYTERSIDSIVGLLAILKAGCVYLPISLKCPRERLDYIAQNSKAAVFLTQQKYKENLKDINVHQICIDSEWDIIGKEQNENHNNAYDPGLLAYIIYTSGTTGNPKGVKIKHESLMNFYDTLNDVIFTDTGNPHYNLGFYCSLDFDMSFKQLLQILNGHTLHIIPEEMRMDLNGIKDFIEKNQIHVFDCPTPVIKVLIQSGLLQSKKQTLKKVLFGGEAIDTETWKIMASQSSVDFYNMYGPTECTIDATMTKVDNANDAPHIGASVLNTQIYLLDNQMREVPGQEPGEIHIAGKCLAEGYLNNDELTNEKFVFAPLGDNKNVRLYKTGDLSRRLPNGHLEYMGRIDRQVKIRGYRIEIQEIEAVIREFENIQDVIVKVIEKASSQDMANKVLAAYLIPGQGVTLNTEALKEFLNAKLPEYMMPSAFLIIEKRPLTNNGKTDYDSLPMPGWNKNQPASGNTTEERTSLEKYLVSVWLKFLGINELNISDNFFEKGGHSLLAMQITAELQDYFETDIPLISLFFEGPTVKEFAAAIEENLECPGNLENILAEIGCLKN